LTGRFNSWLQSRSTGTEKRRAVVNCAFKNYNPWKGWGHFSLEANIFNNKNMKEFKSEGDRVN